MEQKRTYKITDYTTTTHSIGDVTIQVETGSRDSVRIHGADYLDGFELSSVEELRDLCKGIGEVLEKLDE